MLLYNNNGTVSDIQINAIIDGKVTSSLVTASTIQAAFQASASNAIIDNVTKTWIAGVTSSAVAYGLGYPTDKTGWTSIDGVLKSPKNQ